ncbi:MAG TPA: S9 family peptidase, partial [Acidobacteriaceae bacterium]
MRPHHTEEPLSAPQRRFSAPIALPLALSLLLCLPAASLAQASQPKPTATSGSRIDSLLENLARVRTPQTVAISPDGQSLAWTVNGPRGSELHLTGIAPAGSAQDAAWERILSPDTIGDVTNSRPGACTAHHPAWSPDGKQLAFLSNCSGSGTEGQPGTQNNLFVWTLAVNGMKQISHLHGMISSIQWSPDGKSIGFLYVENATRQAGALDAMKPWSGVIGEDGVEVQTVAAVDVSGKHANLNLITPMPHPGVHVYEFTWAPDSKQIAFIGAPPPGENNWWTAKLYVRTLEPLEECNAESTCITNGPLVPDPEVLFDPTRTPGPLHGLQIAVPRFSPDGKQIAFIGGLMSDQGSIGGDIYLIPSAGGEPKDITPNRPASPAYISWLTDRYLGVSEHVGGSSHITALDIDSGKDLSALNLTLPETIISGTDVMSISIALKSRKVAMIRQSFDHPPEIWAGPLNDLKQITHLNDSLKPAWGKTESIDYTNEGFHIQGWLIYPADYDPAKKYPLVVSV